MSHPSFQYVILCVFSSGKQSAVRRGSRGEKKRRQDLRAKLDEKPYEHEGSDIAAPLEGYMLPSHLVQRYDFKQLLPMKSLHKHLYMRVLGFRGQNSSVYESLCKSFKSGFKLYTQNGRLLKAWWNINQIELWFGSRIWYSCIDLYIKCQPFETWPWRMN